MANYPPPYPPPPPGPNGPDWRYQRRMMREQARMQSDIARAQRDAYKLQRDGMRRSSIVGPLLLVTIGIVFLLIQLGRFSFYQFGFWFGHWWPLLLVTAGVILLAEWAFDQHNRKDETQPYVRRGIGGGVITLLVIVAIAGVVSSGIHDGARNLFGRGFSFNDEDLNQFFGDKHESDQTLTQAFPVGSSLSVNNPRGDVTISGLSDDNQMHISLHRQVFTRSDSEAASKAQQLVPNITTNGSAINITLPQLEGASADIVVTVPAGAVTSVTANRGDVHINSIKAPVNVIANHGDVEISAVDGPITAHINNGGSSFSSHSVRGPITLEGRLHDINIADIDGPVTMGGDFFGSTHLEHIRGNVRFHTSRTDFQLARLDGEVKIGSKDLSAEQAVGPLTLTTRSRNITLDRIAGDVAVTNSNGSVDLSSAPPLANVNIQNRNGDVTLTVPEQAGFTVQADSSNGDIENDFGLPIQGNDTRKNFSGTVGKGTGTIRITTTNSGDIKLKKASISPLPPAPPQPPPLSIRSDDGSSVYVGKDGVRITSGSDGSSVIIGKDGLHINTNVDGSSSYTSKDGTKLNSNVDGSYTFKAANGMSLISNVDGSKIYRGQDGTRININADGTHVAKGPDDKELSDSQIRARLDQAGREVKRIEAQRDNERRTNLQKSK